MSNWIGLCIVGKADRRDEYVLFQPQVIDLSYNELSSASGTGFGQLLSVNTTLTELELKWNKLFPADGKKKTAHSIIAVIQLVVSDLTQPIFVLHDD